MTFVRSDFYVYVISRPSGIPCYIGKGIGKRCLMHAKNTHNKHLKRIYGKHDGVLPINRSKECLTNAESAEIETLLISEIGRNDLGLGPLVNHTNGGDGVTGRVVSQRERAAISKRLKGKKRPLSVVKKIADQLRGRKLSPEHCKKIGTTWRGKHHSAEHIEKRAAANRGKKRTIEYVTAMSARMKGRPAHANSIAASRRPKGPRTPEVVARVVAGRMKTVHIWGPKISASQRGKKKPPEFIAKNPYFQKGTKRTKEHCEKLSRAHKGIQLSAAHARAIGDSHIGSKRSAETKARMSIAQKAAWEHRKAAKDPA